ncbi:MAG: PAS domain S-box protein [Candidatus Kerfeldbacteria bacterium]|nr:PAS domain S-box protein [Candidatus Kerfeldbacteria bacterium]
MKLFGLKQETERAAQIKKFFWFFWWSSLLPLLAIFTVVYFSGRTILQNQAIESLRALNNAKSERLDLFIEKLKVRTADWSSDGKIRKDAELISQGRGEPLASDLSLYLRDKKLPIDPAVALVDVLDIDGIVIASSDLARLGKDESKERTSFPEALAGSFGEVIFTPELVVEEDELAGVPMLHFASPLVSAETGKTVGVLLMHLKSDELDKVLVVKERKTLETYLVNRDKLMITPSRFIPNAVLSQSVDTPPVRACLDRSKDYQGSHLNYRGQPIFGVSKCLPEGLGVIITEIDASEAFASITVFRDVAIAAMAIILALALIFAYFSGRKFLTQTTTTTTTTTIIIIIIIIGAALSLFFSKSIEQFVWRVKTEPVFDLAQGQAERHIGDAKYFADWRSEESQQKFKNFVSELKASLPPVAAVKIYNKEAILIWSDLTIYKAAIGKKHEVDDVLQALQKRQVIKSVEAEIQKQIGSANLLEIYTPVFLEDKGAAAGVAEVYFDTADLVVFIRQLQIFIWGLIGISLAIIYSLLHFVFRGQNEKISRQAKELATIIAKSPLGIYTINQDGVIDSFNPKMVEFAGAKSAQEVIGLNALELPTYKAVGLDRFFREGLQGKPFVTETRYLSYTGEKETFRHYFGVPLYGPGGETVERLLLMVNDITARKRLEEELRTHAGKLTEEVAARTAELQQQLGLVEQQNRQLEEAKRALVNTLGDLETARTKLEHDRAKDEALLGSIGDAIMAIDVKERIVFFNPAAEEMTGWRQSEVQGQPYRQFITLFEGEEGVRDGKSITKALLTRVRVKGPPFAILLNRRGDKVPVAYLASPILSKAGELWGVIVVMRDVTHERAVDRMKTEFVSIASHQLRTPLSAMKWFMEMLLHGEAGKLKAEQRDFISNVYRSNERMIKLVNSLLNVSRIEMGRLMIKPAEYDLCELIKGLVAELQASAVEHHQQIKVACLGRSPKLKVDERVFREVISNLISNALKYSPPKSVVEVSLQQSDKDIRIQVKDNGYGIPQEQQDKIFQKFFRADNVVLKQVDGSGLGLYVVKSLLESVGGSVSFTSQENKGSTFTVTLPSGGMKEKSGEVTLS